MPRVTRRGLLAGAGLGAGAALLRPFLGQALAGGAVPRRFVVVIVGNAVEPLALMSDDTQAAIEGQATSPVTGLRWSYDRYGHNVPIEVPAGDLGTARALDPLGDLGARPSTTAALAVRSTPSASRGSSARAVAMSPAGTSIGTVWP